MINVRSNKKKAKPTEAEADLELIEHGDLLRYKRLLNAALNFWIIKQRRGLS